MAPKLRGVSPLLQVYDMPTSVRFYRDQLGFEIVSHSPVLGPPQRTITDYSRTPRTVQTLNPSSAVLTPSLNYPRYQK
jgi:catechol 2,3-dioxygenase-like lactoylglutathione lyase family enzyme